MAGGVEGQEAGAFLLWEAGALQPLRQIPDGSLIGPHEGGSLDLGLDLEVGQGARPLHQGPADEGAARPVQGQGQLGGGRLGVQLPCPVHHQGGSAALQQPGLGPQPGQHPDVLRVDPPLPQGKGE